MAKHSTTMGVQEAQGHHIEEGGGNVTLPSIVHTNAPHSNRNKRKAAVDGVRQILTNWKQKKEKKRKYTNLRRGQNKET